jgi:hypothetical protein
MYKTRTAVIVCAQNTVQTLPEQAVQVRGAAFLNVGAASGSPTLATALSPTSSAALGTNAISSSQIEFNGAPGAPANQVILVATAQAGELLAVQYVPIGSAQAAA